MNRTGEITPATKYFGSMTNGNGPNTKKLTFIKFRRANPTKGVKPVNLIVNDTIREEKPLLEDDRSRRIIPEHVLFQEVLGLDDIPPLQMEQVVKKKKWARHRLAKAERLQKLLTEPPKPPPIVLDKAQSMMEKMGWTGGALGKTGKGIVEPIVPNLTYANKTRGFGVLASMKVDPLPPLEQSMKATLDKRRGMKHRKDCFTANVLKSILDFVRNEREVELLFDSELKDNQRKVVHQMVEAIRTLEDFTDVTQNGPKLKCEGRRQQQLIVDICEHNRYALKTQSEGEYPNRYLCLYKEALPFMFLVTHLDLRDKPKIKELFKPRGPRRVFSKKKKRLLKITLGNETYTYSPGKNSKKVVQECVYKVDNSTDPNMGVNKNNIDKTSTVVDVANDKEIAETINAFDESIDIIKHEMITEDKDEKCDDEDVTGHYQRAGTANKADNCNINKETDIEHPNNEIDDSVITNNDKIKREPIDEMSEEFSTNAVTEAIESVDINDITPSNKEIDSNNPDKILISSFQNSTDTDIKIETAISLPEDCYSKIEFNDYEHIDRSSYLETKITKLFSEFSQSDQYSEFKFLGDFDGEEMEVVNDFIKKVWYYLNMGPFDDDVVYEMERSGYDFELKEDINGSTVIIKELRTMSQQAEDMS